MEQVIYDNKVFKAVHKGETTKFFKHEELMGEFPFLLDKKSCKEVLRIARHEFMNGFEYAAF